MLPWRHHEQICTWEIYHKVKSIVTLPGKYTYCCATVWKTCTTVLENVHACVSYGVHGDQSKSCLCTQHTCKYTTYTKHSSSSSLSLSLSPFLSLAVWSPEIEQWRDVYGPKRKPHLLNQHLASIMTEYCHQNAIIVGCWAVFEGMKTN